MVTPASTSHAEGKSSKTNPVVSDSTDTLIPARSSSARNPAGSASAPGPTPGTGGAGAKAAGGLLEEDYVGLFGTTPNGRNEPTAGPKYAGNLTGGSTTINHIHEAERGST